MITLIEFMFPILIETDFISFYCIKNNEHIENQAIEVINATIWFILISSIHCIQYNKTKSQIYQTHDRNGEMTKK